MPRRVVIIMGAFLAAAAWIVGLWLALPDRGQAATISEPASTPNFWTADRQVDWVLPDSGPVEEWLGLVRAAHKAASLRAPGPVTIHLDMASGYVAGMVPAGLPVEIRIMQGAILMADITVFPVPDSGSFFYFGRPIRGGAGDTCTGGCYPYLMQPGDEVQVIQGALSLSMTVPSLTALADSETDQVFGSAPASAALIVYIFPENPAGSFFTQTVSADSQGDYVVDWSPGLDVRPRDSGFTVYAQDIDRQAYIRFFAPFLRMQAGADRISGMAAPNSWVAITITSQTGAIVDIRWDFTGEDGRFGPASWQGGVPLRLEPGYRVLAEAGGQAFSATVGMVSARSDLGIGLVAGQAEAGTQLSVIRHAGPLLSGNDELWFQPPVEVVTAVANTGGIYQAALALAPGNFGAAIWTDSHGHQTYARYAVPKHHFLLGDDLGIYSSHLFWGQVDAPGEVFTVSVAGPSGYLKELIFETASANGYYAYEPDTWIPSYLVLETGDTITITTSDGVEYSGAMPALTVQADPEADTVFGTAPASSVLTVKLSTRSSWTDSGDLDSTGGGPYLPAYDLSLVITATAQGTYQADFGPLGGFGLMDSGEVELVLEEGHTAARRFLAVNACPPIPYLVDIGRNIIQLYGTTDCGDGQVRLRDAQGNLKAQAYLFMDYNYATLWLYDESGYPIFIQPGDRIEVEAGGSTLTEIVPNLTLVIDRELSQVRGEAPPGQRLQVQVWEHSTPYRYHREAVTATAQGEYLVDFTGILTFTAGDMVAVYTVPGLPRYVRTEALPQLGARLYDRYVKLSYPVMAPFTLTVSVPGEPTQIITGTFYYDDLFSLNTPTLLPGTNLELAVPGLVWPMTIPGLTVDFDLETGTISGQAPPDSRLQIDIYDTENYYFLSLSGKSDQDGNYLFDHPGLRYFEAPMGTVYHYDALGNWTELEFSSFAWDVWLGYPCISGVGGTPGAPIDLVMDSPDGLYKEVITATAAYDRGDFYGCFQRAVQAGTRLTYIDDQQSREFMVPDLQAEMRAGEQVLLGTAPPNDVIRVEIALASYWYALRQVPTNAVGHFGLDLSDLAIDPFAYGFLRYEDRKHNQVSLQFLQSSQKYLPLVAGLPG